MIDIEMHEKAMRDIVRALKDKPICLKGGTACVWAYHVPRFSEDLDFDAFGPINTGSIVKSLERANFSVIVEKEDESPTVTRVVARNKGGAAVKVEISKRKPFDEVRAHIDNDSFLPIPVYSVERLFEDKIEALESRTTARDFFDVAMLLRLYNERLAKSAAAQRFLQMIEEAGGIDPFAKRFLDAFLDEQEHWLGEKDFYISIKSLQSVLSRKVQPKSVSSLNVEILDEDFWGMKTW